MIDPEIVKFIKASERAMKSYSDLAAVLHRNIMDLEQQYKLMRDRLDRIEQAIKPRSVE